MAGRRCGSSRVVIVGLDGAEPEVIERHAGDWGLDTLSYLMKNGAYGRLESTVPAHSMPSWAAFATGMNPGGSGVLSFQSPDRGAYSIHQTSSADLAAETMWSVANRHYKTAGLLNVPLTYPPVEVDGYVLCGLPSIDYDFIPEQLFPEVIANIPKRYNPPEETGKWNDCYLRDLARDVNCKNMFLYLDGTHPVDLSIVVLDTIDRIQHRYWHAYDESHPAHSVAAVAGDAIKTAYKIADCFLAEIVARVRPDDYLFVVSDHGMKACSKTFMMNEYLVRNKYVSFRHGFDRQKYEPAGASELFYNEELYGNMDWKRTTAYMMHEDLMTSCGIRLNAAGREPNGIVKPGAQYEALRDEIAEGLMSLRDPDTGGRVIESVLKREEFFDGPPDAAPDLLVISDYRLSPVVGGKELIMKIEPGGFDPKKQNFSEGDLTGSHSTHGIFAACGSGIVKKRLTGARMIDVAPTVLKALGISDIPESDGEPLDIFKAGTPEIKRTAAENNLRNGDKGNGIGLKERREMIRKLKGYGYIN